jgi:hypothetical protein
LTKEHKRNHVGISSHLLQHYCNEGDNFLNHITTGHGSWINHHKPQSKSQSMQLEHPSSPVSHKFKIQPSAGKLMLTVFWGSHGTTVTTARYSSMLQKLTEVSH